jgi:flagellar hook-associated protein 3 FlgL
MRLSTSMINDSALRAMLRDQSDLARTQNQLATGKSVNSPADDPVAAVQISTLTNVNSQYQQYLRNGQSATTRLTLQEQALSDTTTTLQSARDLIVQANGGAASAADRSSIASQLEALEQQLQGIANRRDALGDYLFSGFAAGTQPFARDTNGIMKYLGDGGSRQLQVDSGTSVPLGDPGSAIYAGIPTGNGTFTTAAAVGNSGTGAMDTGAVTDAGSWIRDQYTITFSDATHWAVTDSTGVPVLDAGGNPVTGTYSPATGGSVAFRGIQVGISGAPAAGDRFTVAPSGRESVFDTLDRVIGTLRNAAGTPAGRAQFATSMGASLQQVDQSLGRVMQVTASVGARLALVNSAATELNSQSVAVSTQISKLGDLDYAKATALYSQQYLALQAAQSSYAQITQLSLFKYL